MSTFRLPSISLFLTYFERKPIKHPDNIRTVSYLWLCESGAQVSVRTAAFEPESGRLELLDDVVRPLLVMVRVDEEGMEQQVVVQSRGQHLQTETEQTFKLNGKY